MIQQQLYLVPLVLTIHQMPPLKANLFSGATKTGTAGHIRWKFCNVCAMSI